MSQIEGIGSEVEPDVRHVESSTSTTSDRRRFDCTKCLREDPDGYGDGSKLVVLNAEWERGHETPIYTHCQECERSRWHVPAGCKPLAYHRFVEALCRRREWVGGESA